MTRVHPVPPGGEAGPLTLWAAHAERLMLCRLGLSEDAVPGAQFLAPYPASAHARAVLLRDPEGWRMIGWALGQHGAPWRLRLTMAQFALIRDAPADVAIDVMPI